MVGVSRSTLWTVASIWSERLSKKISLFALFFGGFLARTRETTGYPCLALPIAFTTLPK